VAILTGEYGAAALGPVVEAAFPKAVQRGRIRILPIENQFFGGNVAVAGLLVGEDLARVLRDQPEGHRYLLPDVCLSGDRFLDGTTVGDLPRAVQVVETSGSTLRRLLDELHPEQD
jgi:NifB/MoaA-like Fe-S oxidoreductase